MATRLEKKSAELMLKKLNAKLKMLFEQQGSDPQIPRQQGQGQQLPQFGGGNNIQAQMMAMQQQQLGNQNALFRGQQEQIYDNAPGIVQGNAAQYGFDPKIGEEYFGNAAFDGLRMGEEGGAPNWNDSVSGKTLDNFRGADLSGDSKVNYGGIKQPKVGGIKPEVDSMDFNWGNALMMGVQAIPSLYNIGKGTFGKTEVEKPGDYYNKNRGQANQLMANRRVNVDPQLEAETAAQNTLQGRLRDSGSISSGQYRTNMQSANLGGMRNRASILANKQNQDLGYMGQQAEMLNAQGENMSQIDMGVGQWNAQNRSMKEGYLGQGISDLGQWAGTQQLMRNQQLTDEQRLQILSVFNTNSPKYFSKSYNS